MPGSTRDISQTRPPRRHENERLSPGRVRIPNRIVFSTYDHESPLSTRTWLRSCRRGERFNDHYHGIRGRFSMSTVTRPSGPHPLPCAITEVLCYHIIYSLLRPRARSVSILTSHSQRSDHHCRVLQRFVRSRTSCACASFELAMSHCR